MRKYWDPVIHIMNFESENIVTQSSGSEPEKTVTAKSYLEERIKDRSIAESIIFIY